MIRTPEYLIKIGNKSISEDLKKHISEITFQEDENYASFVTVSLEGNFSIDENSPLWGARGALEETQLSLSIGYHNDIHHVFTGKIQDVNPIFDTIPSLQITAYDYSRPMQENTVLRSWQAKKASTVANLIAQKYGLQCERKETPQRPNDICQSRYTDWEFLKNLAKEENYKVFIQDKILYFVPKNNIYQSEKLVFSYPSPPSGGTRGTQGEPLLYFAPRLTSYRQYHLVKAIGYDPKNNEEIIYTSDKPTSQTILPGQIREWKDSILLLDEPYGTHANARKIAEAIYTEKGEKYVTGEAECEGIPTLRKNQKHTFNINQ